MKINTKVIDCKRTIESIVLNLFLFKKMNLEKKELSKKIKYDGSTQWHRKFFFAGKNGGHDLKQKFEISYFTKDFKKSMKIVTV